MAAETTATPGTPGLANDAPTTDERSNREVVTQWRKLLEVRRQLSKDAKLKPDASAAEVLDALRKEVPPGLFL